MYDVSVIYDLVSFHW